MSKGETKENNGRWQVPGDLWGATLPTPPLPRGLLPRTIESFAFGKPEVFSPAALAAAALATCSIAASDYVRLVINPTWRECFRSWFGLHGPSSAAKTPTMNAALRPLQSQQTVRIEEHGQRLRAWERSKRTADAEEVDPRPACVRYISHNSTIEALTELARHTDHGIGLVHNELSALIAAMDGQYRDRSASERGHWLATYDGGPHLTDRIGRGEVVVKNFSVSVLGAITTDKLASILRGTIADGLMSRISLVEVPVLPPSEDLDSVPHEIYRAYESLVVRLLENRPSRSHDIELAPGAREVLGGAKRRWQEEASLQAERLPRYAERLGKLPGVAARMGLGFALIDAADLEDLFPSEQTADEFVLPPAVTPSQMHRACTYVDYLARHDLAFYAHAAGQEIAPSVGMARQVAAWILQHGRDSFQLGDITRGVLEWRSLKSVDQLAALELLDQLSWIRPDSDPWFRGISFVRGVTWTVNPIVHTQYTVRAEAARRAAADARRRLTESLAERRRL